MTYIVPNSTVQYFADLGLSKDDTLYFASLSAKNTYFANVDKIATEEALSYVSRQQGVIRSSLPISTAAGIGYLRYKNTSFENFWFYAYVTNVEYVNNGMTEIHFEIDPMMTYMGVFQLGQCFIERQHTLSDAIGVNIADEGLSFGDYVTEGVTYTGFFAEYCIAIVYNPDSEHLGGMYNGLYSGCVIEYYTDVANVNAALLSMIENNKIDSVVAIYQLPLHYVSKWNETSFQAEVFTVNKPYATIDGYVPKNKKLFCYPYKKLSVFNCEGNTVDYKYEYFNATPGTANSEPCNFGVYGIANAEPQVCVVPKFYKNPTRINAWEEAITMTKWSQATIGVDTYKAYLAQRNSSLLSDTVRAVGGGAIAGALTGGIAGAAAGAGTALVKQAAGVLADHIPQDAPNKSLGVTSSDIMTAAKQKDFYFIRQSITRSYAKMLDHYFDMFGYKIGQHAIPVLNARPYWTYVKTLGCTVHGNLPSSDARAIEALFDNGVRFWKHHNNIGNYGLDNSPA